MGKGSGTSLSSRAGKRGTGVGPARPIVRGSGPGRVKGPVVPAQSRFSRGAPARIAKKAAAAKAAAKKATARKVTAKKAPAKKAVAKKAAGRKKAGVKKTVARKATGTRRG